MCDNTWTAEYAENQKIWENDNASASEKLNAWRKQKLLLEHAGRQKQLSGTTHYAMMKDHQEKMVNASCTEVYFQERLKNCQNLLLRSKRKLGAPKCSLQCDLPKNMELPCRGTFESCQYDEINIPSHSTVGNDDPSLSPETKPTVSRNVHSSTPMQMPPAGKFARTTLEQDDLQPVVKRPTAEIPMISSWGSKRTALQNQQPEYPTFSSWGSKRNAIQNQQPETSPNDSQPAENHFRTAFQELQSQQRKGKWEMEDDVNMKSVKKRPAIAPSNIPLMDYTRRQVGLRRGVRSNYLPCFGESTNSKDGSTAFASRKQETERPSTTAKPEQEQNPALANLDPRMVEQIKDNIMQNLQPVSWDDIAGLEYAKTAIEEATIWPTTHPHFFTGLRRPPRGILLFGPPGTGKTLIAKCIASQSKATFFTINPSSLMSKWVGEGEKLVKTLFAVAAVHQPAVVFMDEIDSLMSKRTDQEHESSRRLKNEFFIHLDGVSTNTNEHVIIIGATNRPQELDDAVRRRFVCRLYVPLPDLQGRRQIIVNLMKPMGNNLNALQISEIADATNGYSGADMTNLCREAAMEPIRALRRAEYNTNIIPRDITVEDFRKALLHVGPSVSAADVAQYVEWNEVYGSLRKRNESSQ